MVIFGRRKIFKTLFFLFSYLATVYVIISLYVTFSHTPGTQSFDSTTFGNNINNIRDNVDVDNTKRKSQLDFVCKKVGFNSTTRRSTGLPIHYMVVIEKYKLLYCYIPKVASTTMRQLILMLEGKTSKHTDIADPWARLMVTKLDSIKDEARRQYILDNYYKFFIVRDPLERLVSAFLHKWKRHDGHYAPIVKRIAKRYENITSSLLEAFARNIIDKPFRELDRHWTSQNSLCEPCAIKYDFVGKLETLNRDIAYVMKQCRVNESAYYIPPPSNDKTAAKSTKEDVLHTLPGDVFQKLVEKFHVDIEMFGYPFPNRYQKP